MDKQKLSQLYHLKNEIELIKRQIDDIGFSMTTDTVKGSDTLAKDRTIKELLQLTLNLLETNPQIPSSSFLGIVSSRLSVSCNNSFIVLSFAIVVGLNWFEYYWSFILPSSTCIT